ncbi:hypothetical protein CYMTET_6468 [Cymbomonas tetramitiformis]|uniref:Uncharacterized protein n=1 Tax=Cymbomonas tetramitiformis TaxID=36881 RepID=A0AAE0LHN8_9CHLO|nr:hypothetical protein CYMTET_9356 [Cymbomonas tetramitiformis]KAK3285155.1 hypothetical protein CYMTET_7212 [Cymbomonas tetramitiformis]KAK3285948.1 hypothetical protein CYMTET_6468 [Cymbomonas tetramitiformis]
MLTQAPAGTSRSYIAAKHMICEILPVVFGCDGFGLRLSDIRALFLTSKDIRDTILGLGVGDLLWRRTYYSLLGRGSGLDALESALSLPISTSSTTGADISFDTFKRAVTQLKHEFGPERIPWPHAWPGAVWREVRIGDAVFGITYSGNDICCPPQAATQSAVSGGRLRVLGGSRTYRVKLAETGAVMCAIEAHQLVELPPCGINDQSTFAAFRWCEPSSSDAVDKQQLTQRSNDGHSRLAFVMLYPNRIDRMIMSPDAMRRRNADAVRKY